MEEFKKKVSNYLRLDYDDPLVDSLITVSEGYLINAIDDYEKKKGNEYFLAQSEMVKLVIIQDLFDNRENGINENKDYNYTIRSMILQLQLVVVE